MDCKIRYKWRPFSLQLGADEWRWPCIQTAQPGLGVRGVAPAGPLLLHYGAGGFGEGGHALGAAPLGHRVAA